jgi:HK97 family phage portal protein
MSNVFNLTARYQPSQVLTGWMAGRQRGTVQAAGENSVTTGLTLEQLLDQLGMVGMSSSGENVTAETAMRVSAVYACVSLLAGTISTLPLAVFERIGQDRQPAQHDYWWFLNEQANEDMTSATAWEMVYTSKLLHGDGFAEWLRPSMSSSRVIGFKPMPRWRTQPFRDSSGQLLYRFQPEIGPQRVLHAEDVLHLPSIGFDGLTSPSPITYAAREAVGVALAGQRYAGKFFSEGATFDYALKTAKSMDATQLADLRTTLMARLSGSRSPLILYNGLEPAQLSVNSKDAEILGTRMFSVEEICRIFGVPPFLIGHTEKSTSWGTGLEQQGAAFVRYALRRHLVPAAQEINRRLWPTRARFFVDHDPSALQAGDTKARFEAYRIGLGRAGEQPFLGVDEIRRRENLPPDADLKANAPAPQPEPKPKEDGDAPESTDAAAG